MSGRLVWLNGPFGVGKSTAALHFLAAHPRWRYFDPEQVGYMLRACLGPEGEADFRDLPAWRRLVPLVAAEVARRTGMDLLAVQTVTNEVHWHELSAGLDSAGFTVSLVVLDCDGDVLRSRIESDTVDPGARQWRLDHVASWREARDSWVLRAAGAVLDTTSLTSEQVARAVHDINVVD